MAAETFNFHTWGGGRSRKGGDEAEAGTQLLAIFLIFLKTSYHSLKLYIVCVCVLLSVAPANHEFSGDGQGLPRSPWYPSPLQQSLLPGGVSNYFRSINTEGAAQNPAAL